MVTIIFAHPKHNSLNGNIFNSIKKYCEEFGKSYTSIDLYKDEFSPSLTAEELDGFYNGISFDPLVKKYQDILLNTEQIILIFPIWWNEYPAIFKGFFERVCLGTFAFDYIPNGVKPKLTHIKKSLIVTTSHAPSFVLKNFSGNIIENQVINHMLKGIGVSENKWINFEGVLKKTEQNQMDFIESLRQEIENL